MKQLTYKDFKEGQYVTCVKLHLKDERKDSDFYGQHLTIGKKYKIEDLDFHFWDKICVRSDNKKISCFFPIELFTDEKVVRKMKLNKLNSL